MIHFWADMLFGLPLIFFPEQVFDILRWGESDLFLARLVGAALMGIGWESLLGRNAGVESFRGMLRLKLIWSGSAVFGMSWALQSGGAPAIGWVFVVIFAAFFLLWAYYHRVLSNAPPEG